MIAGISFSLSFLLHYPLPVPKIYSDILFFWISRPEIHGYLIPYIDFNLEYPSIAGLVLYFSSQWHNIFVYYVILSLITFGFVLTVIYILNKVILNSNESKNKINYYIILSPVFVVYSIYKCFDWMGIGFLILSIYFCNKQKTHFSGMFMGFSIATRIIPIVCIPFILRQFKSWKEKTLFLAITFLAWLAPNAYFILKNIDGFLYTYSFQSAWHVEDSGLLFSVLNFQVDNMCRLDCLSPCLF